MRSNLSYVFKQKTLKVKTKKVNLKFKEHKKFRVASPEGETECV